MIHHAISVQIAKTQLWWDLEPQFDTFQNVFLFPLKSSPNPSRIYPINIHNRESLVKCKINNLT